MTNYGYFDDKKKEYVITNPKTPVKWVNYVGTLKFGGIIDHTGGALICKGDPALNRLTKYIPQMPSSDFKGATLYLRFKQDDGSYKVFSPFFVPTLDKYDLFETHVGLSYTTIISEFYGIRTEATIFVPVGGEVELRKIKITNISGQEREIDAIPVVEYTHPDALKQFTNADWVPQTMCSELYTDADGNKIIKQYPFMCKETKINYFTANMPISSFEADRKVFLGDNEYGTFKNPLSLQNKEFSSQNILRGDNIGALMIPLGKLAADESKTFITQFGQAPSVEQALPSIAKYRDEKTIDAALQELTAFWEEYLSVMQISTPDESFNTMVNVHNPRQCHTTKNWSRYLSLYQLGLGARGIGFRDSSQDILGVISGMPEEAKELIKKLLCVQKINGSAMHQFNPLTMVANEGDSREEEGHKYYSDDHLWVILSVSFYIKETGDFNFLQESIPFYEKDKCENPIEAGSVLEHLKRAIEFTRKNVGQHGLPLLGFADWNDTVNLKGNAESVFTANLYGRALREMIELTETLNDQELTTKYKKYHQEMKEVVNKCAWDGKWYIRYFEENGEPVGSDQNSEGKIYTNGQSWPILSGFATKERAEVALQSVNEKLNTKYGIKLSWPGYNGFDWRKGGVTTYPPGTKENGGVFLHANPWVIIAETIVGNGERAYQYYNQINPAAKNDIIDIFEAAPYNYPQNILGDEHPQFGLGRNSWLSGTSSWTYTAATKYIIGVNPVFNGLQINPCIPSAWDGFSVKRKFRGINYDISVKNPEHVCKGVLKLIVNGQEIKGNIVPLQSKDTKVEVIMGGNGIEDSVANMINEKVASEA